MHEVLRYDDHIYLILEYVGGGELYVYSHFLLLFAVLSNHIYCILSFSLVHRSFCAYASAAKRNGVYFRIAFSSVFCLNSISGDLDSHVR
jgi:hypothetical protein